MLWLLLIIIVLTLLFNFVMWWRRGGVAQAILVLLGTVSFNLAFFNPFNNTVKNAIFVPALFIGIISATVSLILWQKGKQRKSR